MRYDHTRRVGPKKCSGNAGISGGSRRAPPKNAQRNKRPMDDCPARLDKGNGALLTRLPQFRPGIPQKHG
jgi:hypothetical protein